MTVSPPHLDIDGRFPAKKRGPFLRAWYLQTKSYYVLDSPNVIVYSIAHTVPHKKAANPRTIRCFVCFAKRFSKNLNLFSKNFKNRQGGTTRGRRGI
jgi:hypothetical protein